MHGLRNAILSGEGGSQRLISTKEACRRKNGEGERSLAALAIQRSERRTTNQRREDRHWGVVDRALIVFRRKKTLVRVVNISTGGLMIETEIEPRIGETIRVEFEGFSPLEGTVRWIKQGRIGLDVGEDAIDLG
jgi:hypothetical protein